MNRRSLVGTAVGLVLLAACSSAGDAGTTRTTPKPEGPEPAGASTSAAADRSSTTPVPAGTSDPATVAVSVQGTSIDVVVALPPGFESGTAYPTVFAFPPGGQDADTTMRVMKSKWAAEAAERGWVVLSPVAPTSGLYYDRAAAALVPGLLDALTVKYPPVGGRYHLAGVSNGGLSAFRAALDHPDRFASLTVFPGYPPESGDSAKLTGLKDMPVNFVVGGDDSGWLESSQAAYDALKKLGARVTLDIRKGDDHFIGSLTGAELFDKIEATLKA